MVHLNNANIPKNRREELEAGNNDYKNIPLILRAMRGLTPASDAAKSGVERLRNGAFGSQLDAMVRFLCL
jgi:hypothetical protein